MKSILLTIIVALVAASLAMAQVVTRSEAEPNVYKAVDHRLSTSNLSRLEDDIRKYAEDKDARIGVAVIVNHTDTVAYNGQRDFPMMSVFKFPLSLAVAQWVDSRGASLNDSIAVRPEFMRANTYSPMFDKYGKSSPTLPVSELVNWSLVYSDNNACDILLDLIGGTAAADSLLTSLSVGKDITIGATEAEMDADHYLIYLNRSTPVAMAVLFDHFDRELRHRSANFGMIATMLEQCNTGTDRLPAALDSNATIGHKTGTGFTTAEGRLTALNDCGYIRLPDGTIYSIAIFVADSGYDMNSTAKMIADISRIVLSAVQSGAAE
ncbi:MAG: class A beta-lactamase [Muribaculaceae bacterium]|nr:class A beta-lactamase [Muribaculaceae bacterium]